MILELLQERGITPRRIAGTHGGEYAGPCPGCGGKDRLRVWPEQGEGGTWYCRQEDKGGDCIEFLRHFAGLSFGEACKRLGVSRRLDPQRLTLPHAGAGAQRPFEPRDKQHLPPAAWREHAGKLASHAHKLLMADDARLVELSLRGVGPDAVERYRLGWLPGERGADCYFRARESWGLAPEQNDKGKPRRLWIPAGLVIPALSPEGEVLRLRVRRPDEHRKRFREAIKYAVIPGSSMHPLLLRPECRAFVVVEAELDAIACASAAEAAGLDVGALAVGTNMGKPDVVAHKTLTRALAILVALDFDAPGKDGARPGAKGYEFWARTYRTARRAPVPRGKDPGEAVALGVDLALWLTAALPPVFRFSAPAGAAKEATRSAEPRQIEATPPRPPAPAESRAPAPAPVAGLYTPLGPEDTLRVLARAGLTVTRCMSQYGEDYRITGHERWPDAAQTRLMGWMRNWGQWVWDALYVYNADNVEVRHA